jgi:hypothetical protein
MGLSILAALLDKLYNLQIYPLRYRAESTQSELNQVGRHLEAQYMGRTNLEDPASGSAGLEQ